MQDLGSIIIYGKGKAMGAVCELLTLLDLEFRQIDDSDADESMVQAAQIVIVTPGIKPAHWLYLKYKKKILSELSFVGKLIKYGYISWRDTVKLVAITGTNGKSTTTRALYQACSLAEQQKLPSQQRKVYIGGNFDRPLSGIIVDIIQSQQTQKEKIIILEVSSFMLRRLCFLRFDIGVLLNIATDHMDRHGSMEDYIKSKLNALLYAKIAITNTEVKNNVLSKQMRGSSLLHKLRSFGKGKTNYPENWITYNPLEDFHNPEFPGQHNKYNFGAIDSVLSQLYENYDKDLLLHIDAVAHRLQSLRCKNNITIIDDSVSSSAHALSAALDAMQPPITLIAGGYDNGENYKGLMDKLSEKVRVGVFYGQTRVHLYPLGKQVITDTFMVETIEEALELAWKQSKKLGITTILYSPGAKSFDQFENVYQRIASFEDLVKKYRK